MQLFRRCKQTLPLNRSGSVEVLAQYIQQYDFTVWEIEGKTRETRKIEECVRDNAIRAVSGLSYMAVAAAPDVAVAVVVVVAAVDVAIANAAQAVVVVVVRRKCVSG